MKRFLNLQELDFTDVVMHGSQTGEEQTDLALHNLDQNYSCVVTMESMGRTLKRDANRFNPMAAKMFNVAFESLTEQLGERIEVNPIDVKEFERSPEQEVKRSVASIDASKHVALNAVRKDVTDLLVYNAHQREELCKAIQRLKAKATELSECMDRGRESDTSKSLYVGDNSWFQYLTTTGEIVNDAGSVMGSLDHFLTEHTHLFKRLIQKQTDWLSDHKKNVLKSANGLKTYSFDPVSYRCNGSELVMRARMKGVGESFYRTTALPGMKAMYFHTTTEVAYGDDAIKALRDSTVRLDDYSEEYTDKFKKLMDSNYQLKVLPTDELKARLAEAQRSISALEHWADMVYIKMWKDASFEHEIAHYLLLVDASINQRLLGELGQALLVQLFNASKFVGEYSYNTIEAMLDFIDINLKA